MLLKFNHDMTYSGTRSPTFATWSRLRWSTSRTWPPSTMSPSRWFGRTLSTCSETASNFPSSQSGKSMVYVLTILSSISKTDLFPYPFFLFFYSLAFRSVILILKLVPLFCIMIWELVQRYIWPLFLVNFLVHVRKFMLRWKQLADRAENLRKFVKIALVGKYTRVRESSILCFSFLFVTFFYLQIRISFYCI